MKQDIASFGVSRETEEKLRAYLALLIRWNSRINLVAQASVDELWQRHVLDSVQLLPLLPSLQGPIIDLGSGAGFPGLVLALGSGRATHLVEADRRKSAFLQEAARILALPQVVIHNVRIDQAELPPAAVVSARALAPLPELLRHAQRLMMQGGIALFPKGRTATQELANAAAMGWTMQIEQFPSCTNPDSLILRLSEIQRVSAHD